MKKVQEIEGLIKSVVKLAEGNMVTESLHTHCNNFDLFFAQNVQSCVERISLTSQQFKKVVPALQQSSTGE